MCIISFYKIYNMLSTKNYYLYKITSTTELSLGSEISFFQFLLVDQIYSLTDKAVECDLHV